ncbi:MAG TPA: Gldg family protein [Candidatus Kapabacteria bacterium]|nr:Gldg family protein [Candidatus Kapabacteria bacterium]
MRKWVIGFHVVLSSVALFAVIGMLNYLAHKHDQRLNLSNAATQKLSPLTERTLADVTNSVKIVCFFDRTDPLFGVVSTLLKEYEARSSKIELEFVDQRMPGRANAIRSKYNMAAEGEASRVIFDSGGKVRTVLSTELSEYAMSAEKEIRRTGFRGEQLFTSALLNVTQFAPVTAYFLQGHGEHGLSADDQGYSRFATMLHNNSIDVKVLPPLLGTNGVPYDCGLLIIGGPSRKFESEEVLHIEKYLSRGGRMLAMFNISASSRVTPVGIEAVLHRWNIQVGFDWVQDFGQGQAGDSNVILTRNYGSHPIVRALLLSSIKLIVPRSVSIRAAQQNSADAPKVTEILFTSPKGRMAVATDASGTAEVRRVGAIPLAVAAEKGGIQGLGSDTGSSRIVAVGESMFVSNQLIGDAANSDFANQIVNWLINRDSMLTEIGPSPMSEYQILLTEEQLTQLRWLFMGAIPGLFVVIGFFVWLRRRV